MKTEVININNNNIDLDKIKQAAISIDQGLLVGFPTETVYGIACRAQADSIEKLNQLKSRPSDKFYTLHIASKQDIGRYVPKISLPTAKLIKNALPGPLTMVFQLDDHDMKNQEIRLGTELCKCLYKKNSIGIRCPDNLAASKLLELSKYPVVASSANKSGLPPATNAKQALEQLADQMDILIDTGPCKYKQASTVVKIEKNTLQVLRQGVYSMGELKDMEKVNFLFICTGNTCRSPMAEGLFKKHLAQKIGCSIEFLPQTGYNVASAGVMGLSGLDASQQAVLACQNKGIDISAHKSRTLSQTLIDEADFIFTMSKDHLRFVLAMCPEAAGKTQLLINNKNVTDPIGQSQAFYDNCANEIEIAVREIICRLKI